MASSISISVIICAHNPRYDYLFRVLEALKCQTLPIEAWELLLIDNTSQKNLAVDIDLKWHPQSRHIREEQLGIVPSRLRGIKEARAQLLVFVDCDNLLEPHYLELCLKISQNYPSMGAWGGQVRARFEVPPPEWSKPYWRLLVIQQFDKDQFSKIRNFDASPCGAGLCVRKLVADKYDQHVHNDPRRLNLGRKGESLAGCEDIDLAFSACDIGLSMGKFTALELTHLIPPFRLEEKYLLELYERGAYSVVILNTFRERSPSYHRKSLNEKIIRFFRLWGMSSLERRFNNAGRRGYYLAMKELKETCQKN